MPRLLCEQHDRHGVRTMPLLPLVGAKYTALTGHKDRTEGIIFMHEFRIGNIKISQFKAIRLENKRLVKNKNDVV